jgi:hypothetical protein
MRNRTGDISACVMTIRMVLLLVLVSLCTLWAVSAGFVYRSGTNFYLDGNTYYFAGANCYNLFTFGDGADTTDSTRIENNYMDKARIDAHMARMALDGVQVLRTWGFDHETWHGFEPQKGVYNEAEFCLFDYILQSAKNHAIRVVVSLENYWEAYGGIDTRLSWEGLSGVSHVNRAQFFTNAGCKASYKNYVNHFINRVNHYTGVAYKNDPTIFAWELMNEPRYQDAGENSTGTTLRAWVDEMAAYIKGLDPNHMVDAGLEGHQAKYGFGGDEGNPFVYIQQSPSIDFCSAHPYPTEPWANLTIAQGVTLVNAWIADAHNVVGKPFFMGEWNVLTDKSNWWTAILGAMESSNGDGSAFWWYEDQQVDPNYGQMQGDAVLAIFKQHSNNMIAKSGGLNPTSVPTTPPQATPAPTAAGITGDVNGSGSIDIVDALLVAQYYVGLNPAGFIAANADVTKDGSVDIVDALRIAQYYVGLITGF